MIKRTFTLLLIIIGLNSFGQNDKKQFVGLNLLQIPTSTINFNYSVEYKPYLTVVADLGYTIGYDDNYDFIGMWLTPHIKLYDGYSIDKHAGGYIKIGGFVNLRKDFEKQNFFHLGLFLTNSIVHEEGLYLSPNDSQPNSQAEKIEHMVNVFGFSTSLGYEFKISDRFKAHFDFQLSFPTDKYLDLYGYRNFIPGMGFKATNSKWFPMLILNLKYRI